ncbi:hypothetical protein [Mangrovibacter phragmitis]|uniref:hypothetical protein n=1 Tax=Mangrovibacter phragmitis TaxID=1691903 RepID=UPI0035198062
MKVNTEVRGGEKLAKKLKQIQDRLTSKKRVLIGLPAGSGIYEDGAPIAVIGAVHEFGSADGRTPERSFLRVPLRQNVDNIKKGFASLSRQVTRGEISAFQMLDQMGARAAGYCKEAIETGIAPANAPSTIKRKGSATPLIDKGILKNAITHVVED